MFGIPYAREKIQIFKWRRDSPLTLVSVKDYKYLEGRESALYKKYNKDGD